MVSFLIKSKKDVRKFQGTGGHNHLVIDKNIKIRKYFIEPIDHKPFDALIRVRYKNGVFLDKIAKSSMFPKNWSITRINEEIALIYDEAISLGKKFQHIQYDSLGGFKIKIEFDELGNITNASPIIN